MAFKKLLQYNRDACSYVAAVLLFITPVLGNAQDDLLKLEPMKTWALWIKSLSLPVKIQIPDLYRPNERLTDHEWAVERVFLLLEHVAGSCDDLEFNKTPLQEIMTEKVGFMPGLTLVNKKHERYSAAKKLVLETDAALTQNGQKLCQTMYRALGPTGTLIEPFQRLTTDEDWKYKTQVFWRAKDACDRPTEYWHDPNVESGFIEESCKEAEKFSTYWGDY